MWPQSRKRPSPALAPEIGDDDLENLEYRPQPNKLTKLSSGAKDEATLEITHRYGHGETVSHHDHSIGLSSGFVQLASKDEPILYLEDNAKPPYHYFDSISSPRDGTQQIPETSEYEILLPLLDHSLMYGL